MIDFYIRMNSAGPDPYRGSAYFTGKHLKEFVYSNDFAQVFGFYDATKPPPLITNDDILFVIGDIHPRIGGNADASYAGILNEIRKSPSNAEKYKGNFIICRLDLENRDLVIINSQLGMKHVYISNTGSRVYAGNNLNLFRKDFPVINRFAVLQQLLFTYTVTDETLLNGVYRLLPGEYAYTNGSEFTVTKYFDLHNLILQDKEKFFDIEEYVHLFNKSVRARAHDGINVSFTGGFDGRTIISSLISQAIKFQSYSFGKKNGENTEVPSKISEALKINYEPVYLDDDYESSYTECAKEVLYFSDGASFNERANYIYAFRKLSGRDTSVLSGLVGGEILRPVHLRTDYINELYYQSVYLGRRVNFQEYLRNRGIQELLKYDFHTEISYMVDVVREKFKDLNEFKSFERGHMYYLYDLMSLGFRMYYGTEIHTERAYCDNMTPFYDLDLIEYLFSTDYTEIYKNAFKSSKIFRWKGQKIYPSIIGMNYPDLNYYPVDRGYPPSYLLNPVKMLLIPYLYNRRKKNRGKHADFNEAKWSRLFTSEFMKDGAEGQDIFDNEKLKMESKYHSEGIIEHSSALTRTLSLAAWLSEKL